MYLIFVNFLFYCNIFISRGNRFSLHFIFFALVTLFLEISFIKFTFSFKLLVSFKYLVILRSLTIVIDGSLESRLNSGS